MEDFLRLSATTLVNKIKNKVLSSVEVVQAHIDRINAIDPKINAVQQLHAEQALQRAQAADITLAKGKKLGKLHGLPISFKDTSYVKGFKISRGSKLLYGKVAMHDCTVAARLKNEGAIILALTNVPELLMRFQTDNILYGRTNNPYDNLRTPGGSSGGEAALIAACGSPLGIGSDFAGSIRQPAHNCGIAGIKPTQMLIPNTGAFPIDNAGLILNCATLGPMARYVEDLCLTLPLIAGPDGYDPHIPPTKLGNINQVKLSHLHATYFFSDGYNRIDNDTASTMQTVVNALQSEVKSIKEHQDKCLKEILQVHFETTLLSDDCAKGLNTLFKDLAKKDISPFMQDTMRLLKTKKVTTNELRMRLMESQHFPFKFMQAYHDTDIIICPVSISPAIKHGLGNDALSDYTFLPLFNITGWPAVTVRCGTNKQGLPIGIQIAAKPWHDHIALAVALRLEKVFGGWQMPAL